MSGQGNECNFQRARMMRPQSGLCSDCLRLLDGARTLAHEYLLETDTFGRSYQCLICDAHLICQHRGNAAYWMLTSAPLPEPESDPDRRTGTSKPPSAAHKPDRRTHR
jgi:hypothetical protein